MSSANSSSGSGNSSSESGPGRSYTSAQSDVVQRVFECDATAYYAILGVGQDADADEIKRAFKSLALLLHPDKNAAPRAEEAFKRVRQAWEVLSDEQERAAYDNDHERRAGGFEFASFFSSSSAADDSWNQQKPEKDRNPPRPRNESRKQRRRRKHQRQQHQEEERASEAELDAEELLRRFAREAGRRGLRFWYCRQCDDVHVEGDVHIQSQSHSQSQSQSQSQSRRPSQSHSQSNSKEGGGFSEALFTLIVMAAGLLLVLYALKFLLASTFGKIVLGIAGILVTVLYFVPDPTPEPPPPPSTLKTRTFYRQPTPYP